MTTIHSEVPADALAGSPRGRCHRDLALGEWRPAARSDDGDGRVFRIRNLSASMLQMEERTVGIAAALEEQGQMTYVISRSIGEVASGTAYLAQTTNSIRETAMRTHDVAGSVLNSTQTLEGQAAKLETAVHQFMQRVATA